MLTIVIATANRHKANELRQLLNIRGIRWRTLADSGLRRFGPVPAVRETGKTFDANAVKKARAIAHWIGMLALADDSGLEVEALGWGPGVRSARFAGRHGDDAANNRKLLRMLRGLPGARRRARYRCVLALAGPAGVIAVTRGAWTGRIAEQPAGQAGFGYDPIFLLPGLGKTVGQLPAGTKQRLSHRAAAARRMRSVLRQLVMGRERTHAAPP
jgi:XTP/dITP diphosphohydrolase